MSRTSSGPKSVPLISVIIPTYNRVALLRRAILSVQRQTYPNIEIIVVDDGSSSRATGRLVRRITQPLCSYIRQTHAGPATARNRGLERARGQYIAFLDDDDRYLPRHLAVLMARMLKRRTIGMVYSDVRVTYRIGKTERSVLSVLDQGSHETDFQHLYLSNTLWQAEALRSVGGFDTAILIGEDWDLWMRVGEQYPIERVPEITVVHGMHTSNLSLREEGHSFISRIIARKMHRLHLSGGFDAYIKKNSLRLIENLLRARSRPLAVSLIRKWERVHPSSFTRACQGIVWVCKGNCSRGRDRLSRLLLDRQTKRDLSLGDRQRVRFFLAVAHYLSAETEQAIGYCRALVREFPHLSAARVLWARCLVEKKAYTSALGVLRPLPWGDAAVHTVRGCCYLRTGNIRAARKECGYAVRLEPLQKQYAVNSAIVQLVSRAQHDR